MAEKTRYFSKFGTKLIFDKEQMNYFLSLNKLPINQSIDRKMLTSPKI